MPIGEHHAAARAGLNAAVRVVQQRRLRARVTQRQHTAIESAKHACIADERSRRREERIRATCLNAPKVGRVRIEQPRSARESRDGVVHANLQACRCARA